VAHVTGKQQGFWEDVDSAEQ